MEQFGQIVCNRHEALSISLKEVCRSWHVELRIHGRAESGGPESHPSHVYGLQP